MGSRGRTTTKSANNSTEDPSSSTANNSENDQGSGSGDPCVVCAGKPSKNIIRDTNFEKMIHLFIEGLKIDVKPGEYKKLELCKECFELLVEFYDTNDVLVHLEKHMNEARTKIISKTLEGIKLLKKNGTPLLPVHVKVISSWGEDPKIVLPGVNIKQDPGASVSTFLEDATSPSKSSKRSSQEPEPQPGTSASADKAAKSNGITISNGKGKRNANAEAEKASSLRDRKKRK